MVDRFDCFSGSSASSASSTSSASTTSATSATAATLKRKRERGFQGPDVPSSRPTDTHLIPEAPILAGAFRHTMFQARSSVFHHVWVEYALSMLHSAFKRNILSKHAHVHLLTPFTLVSRHEARLVM
jgi:hypothetical protein